MRRSRVSRAAPINANNVEKTVYTPRNSMGLGAEVGSIDSRCATAGMKGVAAATDASHQNKIL